METLYARIREEAVYLGNGIIKVDGFINHQLDPLLTQEMGQTFAHKLAAAGVTGINKIVTAEVSGIAPALAAGYALQVPVVYARKHRPVTMAEPVLVAEAPSRTKGGQVQLMLSPEFLGPADLVLLIDDFLASGTTITALIKIIQTSGATLRAIGTVIEKVYEPGRANLQKFNVPILSLARLDVQNERVVIVPEP
jgi:xanthine phosphoribosyltransferase